MSFSNDVSAHEKFPPEIRKAGFPFVKWTFLDVFEPEKTYSGRRRNGRLTVREMTIFFRRFGTRKNFFPKYETAVFPFAKWPFLEVLEPEKAYSSLRRKDRLTVREMIILPTFRHIKNFPPEIRNGRVPFRVVTIFGQFGALESLLWPPTKRPARRSRNDLF